MFKVFNASWHRHLTLKTFFFISNFQYYNRNGNYRLMKRNAFLSQKPVLAGFKYCKQFQYQLSKGYLLVASHPPFWVGGWVQHQNPWLTLHTLTHAMLDQRVRTGRVSALVAAKLFTHVRKRGIVVAVRAERETLQNVRWKCYRELQDS